jgi:putative sterol carrier protein
MSDITPKQYFEEKVAANLAAKKDIIADINAIYEFQITGDNGGTWSVDVKSDPPQVTSGSTGNADCTVTIKDENFISMISGSLNPQMAFMTGKLKVTGNMGLALKLQNILV